MLVRIETIDDPRIKPYRNLPDRTLRGESIFLAEGRLLTHRLLDSRYETESLFVTNEFLPEFQAVAPESLPIFVAEESLLLKIVGFNFHRGALAVGKRGTGTSIEELMRPLSLEANRPLRLVICPEITKPENMGLVFRNAAGLNMDGVVLGERCCDPFSRRCMRVSMGAVLRMPFVKTINLQETLKRLKQEWQVTLMAAVVDPTAESLPEVDWPDRLGALFGNEMDGLTDEWLSLCDRRVTIPITSEVDSLNLGVAAGIFMFEMGRNRANRDASPSTALPRSVSELKSP